MASEQGPTPTRVRVSASTAFKTGFFAAFGVVVFALVLGVIAVVVALVLAALGRLPSVARLFNTVVIGS